MLYPACLVLDCRTVEHRTVAPVHNALLSLPVLDCRTVKHCTVAPALLQYTMLYPACLVLDWRTVEHSTIASA